MAYSTSQLLHRRRVVGLCVVTLVLCVWFWDPPWSEPAALDYELLRKHINATLAKGQTDERVIPVFGTMCTDIDIAFMKGQLMAIDVGVRSFFVTTNAVTDVDLLTFLEEVAADFGPDRFFYIRNEQNAGVAPIWNAILHHGFERNNYSWVMIGNADLHPHKGQLAPWLEWVYSGGNVEACAVLYYTLHWAAFGLTRTGFEKLGMFDENLWPAYGEDIEYIVRAQAAEQPLCKPSPAPTYEHNIATNLKNNAKFKATVKRFANGQDYLLNKWGFDIFNRPDPIVDHFKHPWNQKDVAYSTWVFDPNLRSCIETGHGVKIRGLCAYDLVGLAPLIHQNNRPAVWVDQRLSGDLRPSSGTSDKTPRFEGRKKLSAPM
ncbi:hypothetical protein DIPPA_01728 [Diplonema papillatum]|nr:hypothetical protein DIPPA_01728 [Diplonema papillatum]